MVSMALSMATVFTAAVLELVMLAVVITHKIHWLIASVVLVAVTAPVLGVARWHVQIDR